MLSMAEWSGHLSRVPEAEGSNLGRHLVHKYVLWRWVPELSALSDILDKGIAILLRET